MIETDLVEQFKKDIQEYEDFEPFITIDVHNNKYMAYPVFTAIDSPIEGVFTCKQNGWEWRIYSPRKINGIGCYQVVFRKVS